ncbi:MAG: sulfur carrier protein ThiS [Anaerolineae bacterium]
MITINKREKLDWQPGMTVQDVLDALNYTYTHIIVSVNGTVIPRAAYKSASIPDEADVRVIHLIAGG